MALADLQKLWGSVPEVSRSWVFQWKEGLPQYKVGHVERVKQALAAENLPGLIFSGCSVSGRGFTRSCKNVQRESYEDYNVFNEINSSITSYFPKPEEFTEILTTEIL